MSGRHTPGPWQSHDEMTTDGFVTIIANVDGEYVEGAPSFTYDTIARCEDEFGQRLPNVAANVRLINATPDMLAVLEWISYHADNQDMNHVDFRVEAATKAREIIAKAVQS